MESRLETVPPGTGHLDTVRALHQTVVSLRTALEISKNELKELKQKYEQHAHCLEYADVIEKLTVENHILRCKIIDSDYEEKVSDPQNIKLEVTHSPHTDNIEYKDNQVVKEIATEVKKSVESVKFYLQSEENSNICSAEKFNEIPELCESPDSPALNLTEISPLEHNTDEDLSQITSFPKQENEEIHQPSYKTKLELLSKFDVRIKVRTLKEGSFISSTTSESGSSFEEKKDKESESKASFHFEERREQFEKAQDSKDNKIHFKSVSRDNVNMAVPNEADVKSKTDKFDVQVRITSEENLAVKETVERSRQKDTLNLDVDDLSLRSMSEGDNSVFSEGGTTPVEQAAASGQDRLENEASGNESEEVDDIELIFTADESKDIINLQEDLVSIRESEWQPQSASTHSTPVLIKFHTLDPDFQPGTENENAENENQENSSLQNVLAESLKVKRVSLPNDKEIRHVAFGKGSLDLPGRGILKSCDNKSDNMLYKRSPNTSTRRLDSVDSISCEYNRGLSLDNTKSSSFELGSSMDILHRDESVDSFHKSSHLGHRFSVFAETDISKCGISEDDLAGNLNARRNTCPNPFQYRPLGTCAVSRPWKSPAPPIRLRPLLREGAALLRRENGAQTDVSALPPRWSSDGYLAHNMALTSSSVAPTLPQRTTATSRRLTVPDARAPPLIRRNDEARRVLLSDIGFTSMVPELSRSADPVWALGKRIPHAEDTASNSTSKFLSRGSSYRSPCLSIDRSNDWTPHTVYAPANRDHRAWRSSLPDVRQDDTDDLLRETENYLRRSIDNLQTTSLDMEKPGVQPGMGVSGQPYIPAEPRHLRLGHAVKVITPLGRIAVGRVRYVGLAGGTAASSSVVVGAEFLHTQYPGLPRNDGTHKGRRYFLTPPQFTALFVPFSKIVMAWTN